MTSLSGTFGIAVRNFTTYPDMPDINALVEYGVKMEELGFDDALAEGLVLIEWPEKAWSYIPPRRLELRFEGTDKKRRVTIKQIGPNESRS